MNRYERTFKKPFSRAEHLASLERNFPEGSRVEIRNLTNEKSIYLSRSLRERKKHFSQTAPGARFGRVAKGLGSGAMVELENGSRSFFPYVELKKVVEVKD